MKLNHLALPVPNVRATRAFFETYFGFRCTLEVDPDKFAGLTDDAGMWLTITNLDGVAGVTYPKWFHIGFRRDSDAEVDDLYQRLKADGYEIGQRQNQHGAWTFYLTAPGGFGIEIMHEKEPM